MIQYQRAIAPLYIGMESFKKKEINNSKFESKTNSDTCSDSPKILLLSTAQRDCQQFSDKSQFWYNTIDSTKWLLSTAHFSS